MADFVLVPGPLVRGSSWQPTADRLRAQGQRAKILDVLEHRSAPPSWATWTSHLLARWDAGEEAFLVGHSSASTLVAELATKRPVKGVIIVDGEVPPPAGPSQPVRPALHHHIVSLAGPDGTRPVWSKWFLGDAQRMSLVGLDVLAADPSALARLEEGLPRMHVDWFSDSIDLANWTHVPAAYIQTSPIYAHAIAEARRRGWPTIGLRTCIPRFNPRRRRRRSCPWRIRCRNDHRSGLMHEGKSTWSVVIY